MLQISDFPWLVGLGAICMAASILSIGSLTLASNLAARFFLTQDHKAEIGTDASGAMQYRHYRLYADNGDLAHRARGDVAGYPIKLRSSLIALIIVPVIVLPFGFLLGIQPAAGDVTSGREIAFWFTAFFSSFLCCVATYCIWVIWKLTHFTHRGLATHRLPTDSYTRGAPVDY